MIGYKPRMPDLSDELREQIVRRIVAAADPMKIVLFGSRARGDQRPDSDLDLLIVQNSSLPRYRRASPIHAALANLPLEVDAEIVVYTPQEIAQWRDVPSAFVSTALREGKVLYEKGQP